MDSGDQAAANVIGQFADLAPQFGRVGGDEGGDERGGAVPAVEADGGGCFGVESDGEVRPSSAVHMCVDEARHDRHRAQIVVRGAWRSSGADCDHLVTGKLNPPGPQQF